ncbi:hypothetical protein L9F63_002857, partial [Diploptera punctata]
FPTFRQRLFHYFPGNLLQDHHNNFGRESLILLLFQFYDDSELTQQFMRLTSAPSHNVTSYCTGIIPTVVLLATTVHLCPLSTRDLRHITTPAPGLD